MGWNRHDAASSRERRQNLTQRARELLAESERIVAEAKRVHERSRDLTEQAATVLDQVGYGVRRDIRRHVDALIQAGRHPIVQPTTVVGSERIDSHESMDLVLLRRYGRLIKVGGSISTVAAAIVEQPALVLVLGDLVGPGPVMTGLLAREYAPESGVLVVTESSVMRRAARESGLPACEPTIGTHRFQALLDEMAA